MKKLLLGLLTIGSISSFAQDENIFKIINSTYPQKSLELTCIDVDCSKMEVRSYNTINGYDRMYELDKILDVATYIENSSKSVGRVTGIDCRDVELSGAPCFGATKSWTRSTNTAFKEGRALLGVTSIILTPLALLWDLASSALVFPVVLDADSWLARTGVEITSVERRLNRKSAKKMKYLFKKLENASEEGILSVKDRVFYKIFYKLKSI